MAEIEFIRTLTLIFVLAAVLLLGATRLGLPVIPFYIVAGVFGGAFIDEGQLLDLAQWGIAFLVFAFAVELEPFETESIGWDSAIISVGQMVLMGAAMYGVGLALGLGATNAVYFAVAGTLSSSLVALDHLEGTARSRVIYERLGEAIHFVEDLGAILVILLLSALVYSPEPAWLQIVAGFGLIGVAAIGRQYVFRTLASLVGGDTEVMMLTGVSFIIGFIAVAELVGVSIVVGAFAAGLAVESEFPYDIEVVDAIGYLEDFFSPIFFVTVGALVTVPDLWTIGVAAALVAAVVVVNPLVTAVALLWRGYDPRTATLTGLSLGQISEFSLVIAIEGLLAGVLVRELFDAIILAAIATMLVSSYAGRHGDAVHRRLAGLGLVEEYHGKLTDRSRVDEDISDHVIVVDFGRMGRKVIERCEAVDRDYVVIENNPNLIDEVSETCDNYVFGDMVGENVWELARAEEADLVVSTVLQEERSRRVLDLDVDADSIVRASDEDTAARLLDEGALYVALPDVLASHQLVDHVERVLDDEEYRRRLRKEGQERVETKPLD